jgi:hypothetical protein
MVHSTASILILRSADGVSWEEAHRFQVAQRDTRDPHFLVFQNKLFVYTGTWYSGTRTPDPAAYDLNQHLGYAAWSDDGATWHRPIMLEGTFGHYIWRAAAYGGKAFLCGRRKTSGGAAIWLAGVRPHRRVRKLRFAGSWTTSCTSSPSCPAAAMRRIPASLKCPKTEPWYPTTRVTNAMTWASP